MMRRASRQRASRDLRRRAIRRGGTIINVITAVVFFGLLGLGIWWVTKQWGQAAEEYTGAMIKAKHDAFSVTCQANMQAIAQNIQIYSISNDRLPESMDELRQWSGSSRLYRCPAPDGAQYIYVGGQSRRMSASNILVYEPNAVHDGQCSVLLLGGTVGFLTPEQLDQALARMEAEVRVGGADNVRRL